MTKLKLGRPFYTPLGFRVARALAALMFVGAYVMGRTDAFTMVIAVLTLSDWILE